MNQNTEGRPADREGSYSWIINQLKGCNDKNILWPWPKQQRAEGIPGMAKQEWELSKKIKK